MKKDPYKHLPTRLKKGNCYKQAIDYMLSHSGLVLCHGWVSGRGELYGVRFSHAWVEDEQTAMVIDPSNKGLEVPRIIYYAIGNIVEERVHKYSRDEMLAKLEHTKKAGPWNSEFDEYEL